MWISLGYVTTTAGTPVAATKNVDSGSIVLPDGLSNPFVVHTLLIQQVRTNVGYVLVGTSALNESTGAGLNAVLAIPTANSLPNVIEAASDATNAVEPAKIYVDFSSNGDKALVSVFIL